MKHKFFLLLLLLTMMTATYVFADDDPGAPCTEDSDPSDPFDNSCPLDSWVYMLALAPVTVTLASVFARSEEGEDKKLTEEDEN
jgi:hypothetical protein